MIRLYNGHWLRIIKKMNFFYSENLTWDNACCIVFLVVRSGGLPKGYDNLAKNISIKENNIMPEKMKEIIAEQLSIDASEIELTSNFKEDLENGSCSRCRYS